ncbi:MAG: hypothetical protein WCP20_15775 [Desulfuromonadales bacterium]
MRDFFSKRGVDITDEDYREMKANIRTFFELLDRWDSEQNVTNLLEFSKIQTDDHAEGGHNE